MLECLIQFPSALPPRQGSGQPSLAGAIFFQFRQIPLNGANHTDKTDIPAFGMDIMDLKSIEFRSHCSFPCSVQYLPLPLKWLQCSEFKWTQLGPKLQLNLNVITNRSLRLPQVSFHFRTLRCLTDFAEQSWNVQINFQGKPESPSRVCWISNHR